MFRENGLASLTLDTILCSGLNHKLLQRVDWDGRRQENRGERMSDWYWLFEMLKCVRFQGCLQRQALAFG